MEGEITNNCIESLGRIVRESVTGRQLMREYWEV